MTDPVYLEFGYSDYLNVRSTLDTLCWNLSFNVLTIYRREMFSHDGSTLTINKATTALGPTYNGLLAEMSRCLYIKIIDSNVKHFDYNKLPLSRSILFVHS